MSLDRIRIGEEYNDLAFLKFDQEMSALQQRQAQQNGLGLLEDIMFRNPAEERMVCF